MKRNAKAVRFIHAGSTELPVRDINANYKDDPAIEPYIEYGWERNLNDNRIIGAENYCSCCYQPNVKQVVDKDMDYLFLVSYPLHDSGITDENLIVGYIRHEDHDWRTPDRVAVIGEIRLYSFEHGIPLSEYGFGPSKGPIGQGPRLYEDDTEEILNYFDQFDDVTEDCLEKTLEMEREDSRITDNSC